MARPGIAGGGEHISTLAILVAVGSAASGAVLGVIMQHVVDERSATNRARAASSHFERLKLDGVWYAFWESSVQGQRIVNGEQVTVKQVRNRLFLENVTVSLENPEGGYLWRGELEVWDNQHLLGWYVAREPNVLSKGALYLILHPSGREMSGRWVGRSYDGELIEGYGCLARTVDRAHNMVNELIAKED